MSECEIDSRGVGSIFLNFKRNDLFAGLKQIGWDFDQVVRYLIGKPMVRQIDVAIIVGPILKQSMESVAPVRVRLRR